jgi:hypothetical protein
MTYMAREREREREREKRVERGLVRGVVRAACTDNEMTHVQLGMNESVWRGVRVGFFCHNRVRYWRIIHYRWVFFRK